MLVSPPTMLPVISQTIASIGYRKPAKHLYVRFKNGNSLYVYEEVPESVYKEFLKAESKGKFLQDHVKGVFTYRRIE